MTARAAGFGERVFVALVDADRRVLRCLSGNCTLGEALHRLRWLRHDHPEAQIVREVTLREILE